MAAGVEQDLSEGVARMPFAARLGLREVRGGVDRVTAVADWAPEHCTSGNILHGGYLMAIADTLGAMLAGQNLDPDAGTTTIESKTNFIRGVSEGTTIAITSVPVHVGRTTIVVQTDVTRPDGKLVSRTTQTQAVLRRP
jgi:uncharacterized protein (TIGR00369 family)